MSQQLQQEVLTELAHVSANDICKRIILGLPFDPPLTLDFIIEACTKRAIVDLESRGAKGGLRGRDERTVTPAVPEPLRGSVLCYNYGQEGHIAKFCQHPRKKGPFTSGEGDQQKTKWEAQA